MLAGFRGNAGYDIAAWLTPLVVAIAHDEELTASIASRAIEAVFWIALLGAQPLPEPTIAPHLLEKVSAIEASVFVENYTDLATGNPRTSWLVGP